METRDNTIVSFRGEIFGNGANQSFGEEKFQNETLRPILKIQNDQENNNLLQAKNLYQQAVRLDNSHWDTRHNLDRLILLLPGTPTPGVGESDSPGLIMGNIPVGLP